MDTVVAHFRDNAQAYIIIGLCALPILIVTRKYSLPLIMYIVEYIIYLSITHSMIYAVLNLARWFKENSSMRALRADGKPVDAPTWKMPYIEFWKTVEYDPNWIWKVEIIVAILIFGAMWRYRPMKVQAKRVRRYSDTGKKRTDFSKFNPKARRNTQ